MKFIVLLLSILSQLYFSQNTFEDISKNRITISKSLFGEVLNKNRFNSSIFTQLIFKNEDISIYYISTFSPHAYVNIGIVYKRKFELFELREKDEVKCFLFILNRKYYLPLSNISEIEDKINIYW